MKIFADSGDLKEIEELSKAGLIDGVTTNPSLAAKSGRSFKELIVDICSVVAGPVSAQVAATEYAAMIAEGEVLAGLAENVVVKLPATRDGFRAARHLAGKGVRINVTLCFSPNQALLAAKVGASYISPFVGRLDDINLDGVELISQIRRIYDNYAYPTEILAASIRTANHVTRVALAGADVATIPPSVVKKLADHPLTKSGLEQFSTTWHEAGQSIL